MDITDDNIEKAENLLLPERMTFDEERRQFIKHLDSCDLLAVPGSGKTTALQAKLCCLSQHFPLEENQGILVLSHTNNAVDEIKKKLRTECYQLFEAPHFIGTVQDFVDKYLVIPYYELFYKKKVHVIDDVAYRQEVDSFLARHWDLSAVTALKFKNFDFSAVRLHKNEGGSLAFTIGMGEPLTYPQIKKWEKDGTVMQKHTEIETFIKNMKSYVLQRGVLTYDDCYILAESYIQKFPFIIKTLRRRFKYIFIDETQDLKKYQLDLIDKIFDTEECCLQRIGDKNQTIFKRPDRDIPEQWKVRNLKTLLNSFRLTDMIAKVVNPFTVDKSPDDSGNPRFVVKGKRIIDGGDIPPYMIVFDKNNKDQLLPCFNLLIEKYNLRDCEEGKKYGFHIVGWNCKPNSDGKITKLRLCDIFSNCNKQSDRGLSSYITLSEFLVWGCREESMSDCKSVVCRILVYVLRLLGKVDGNGRYYSQTSMMKFICENGEDAFSRYLLFVYKATVLLYSKKFDECYQMVKEYIGNEFSSLFNISENNKFVADFEGTGFESDLIQSEYNDVYPDIKIGSVHSVKGQTHCATMYVETSFKRYESEHLFKIKKKATKRKSAEYYPNPLFQENVENLQVTMKSVMHMMYVGFSRPTHLLCYAVVKDNWDDERIERMEKLGWKIIKL